MRGGPLATRGTSRCWQAASAVVTLWRRRYWNTVTVRRVLIFNKIHVAKTIQKLCCHVYFTQTDNTYSVVLCTLHKLISDMTYRPIV